jgi:hypothetical protein
MGKNSPDLVTLFGKQRNRVQKEGNKQLIKSRRNDTSLHKMWLRKRHVCGGVIEKAGVVFNRKVQSNFSLKTLSGPSTKIFYFYFILSSHFCSATAAPPIPKLFVPM